MFFAMPARRLRRMELSPPQNVHAIGRADLVREFPELRRDARQKRFASACVTALFR